MWLKVISSWTELWVVSWGSDSVCPFQSLLQSSSFTGRCSPSDPVPPLPLFWLFTLSPCSTTPLQFRGTTPPSCYPPLPLSFGSVPTLSCWGGTLNAFNVALAPCSSCRSGWSGSSRLRLHPGWLMAVMPSPLTLHAPPLARGTA